MRIRRCGGLLLLAAALWFGTPQPARTDDLPIKGPLPTRNAEPLNTPFLRPVPTDASVLAAGRMRIEANLDIANSFLTLPPTGDARYATDFEEQRFELVWARGLSGGEVAIRVPLIARNGGILDGFINFWHDLVKREGGGRGSLPNYRALFAVTDDAGRTIINDAGGAAGLGDITFEVRRSLTPPADLSDVHAVAASARALIKLPTGSHHHLFGSGGWDFGAGVALSARPLRRLALHGNFTLVLVGDPRTPNLHPRRTRMDAMIAVEYLLNGRTSILLQTDDNPAPIRSAFAFANQPRRGFTLGLWRQVNAADRLHVSISENQYGALAKLAPDFTLSLGLRRDL